MLADLESGYLPRRSAVLERVRAVLDATESETA
jgi:hypothetical protein